MSKEKQFIPKSKGKKPTKLQVATEQPDIPKDLQDMWSSVEAAATTANLLQKGYFPHSYAKAISASIAFMTSIHQGQVEACLKHPQAKLIPELKAELEKEAADGKKEA